MIYKKSRAEIALMRKAGALVASTLEKLQEAVRPGVTTKQLDDIAERWIASHGGTPSFKGYRGFPASICASPNNVIVHGIPSEKTILAEGDIISLDVGVIYNGFHGDSAWTFPVGDVEPDARRLLEVTEKSLEAAIAECDVGKRLGDVGHAVEKMVVAAGFSVVREYAGHGVGRSLHEEPWIPNYGPPGRREMLSAGMTFAIEPLVNIGTAGTKTLADKWTVVTADGSLSAHFEHTIAVTDDGPEVLTRP